MYESERKLKEIRSALEQERRIDLHHHSIQVALQDGTFIISGEVDTVAAKKLAVEYTAALADGGGIVDRVTVKPGEVLEDAALCDLVFAALYGETAFNDFSLHTRVGSLTKAFRETPRTRNGNIEILVQGGVVTLAGQVESYAHKALAGVLAWWRRGTRDVINNLAVEHAMDDADGEMADVLRMVLEKDRFVDSGQIRAQCRSFTAILDGVVKNEMEKTMAENDAWYVIGVIDVENRLQVRE